MCLATAWIASSAAAQYEAPGPAERCTPVDEPEHQFTV